MSEESPNNNSDEFDNADNMDLDALEMQAELSYRNGLRVFANAIGDLFNREGLFDRDIRDEWFDPDESLESEEIPNVFHFRGDNYERMQLEMVSNSSSSGSDILSDDSSDETDGSSMTNMLIGDGHSAEQNSSIEFPLQCYICKESSFNKTPTTADCGHIFCSNCIESYVQINRKCPVCEKENPSLIKLYGIEIE